MRLLVFLCLVFPALGRQIETFVVGGSNANIANFRHQLSLRSSGSHTCGASLMSTTRAVCVAHCGGSAISVYSILGGTSDRTVTNCATCVTRSLTGFSRHPQYSNTGATGYPNDIAVLIFSAVTYNSNMQAIVLATSSDGNYAGATCTISGWGRTSSTSGLPTILQQASMQVLTNSACINYWGAARINNGHICVFSTGKAACSGDSGGPLTCSGKLAGATSWVEASCSPSYPSVYSRISYFYSWIMAQ